MVAIWEILPIGVVSRVEISPRCPWRWRPYALGTGNKEKKQKDGRFNSNKTLYKYREFEMTEPYQAIPRGVICVIVNCVAHTLSLPSFVKKLVMLDGSSLEVVPGVETVNVDRGACVGCFSNGTVCISDKRGVVIGREAFEGVETLRSYYGSLDNAAPTDTRDD